MMKRFAFFALVMMFIMMTTCSNDLIMESPEGIYSHQEISLGLLSDGSFFFEHLPSDEDGRHYMITGTYSYTHEFVDEETAISHGHIDISVDEITLDDQVIDSLELTDAYTGDDLCFAAELLGWWRYEARVVDSRKMKLRLNLPVTGYPPEESSSPCDWIIAGDPLDCST